MSRQYGVSKTRFSGRLVVSLVREFSQASPEHMLNFLCESHPAETQVEGLPRAASLFSTSLVGIKVAMEAQFFMVALELSTFWFMFVKVFHS